MKRWGPRATFDPLAPPPAVLGLFWAEELGLPAITALLRARGAGAAQAQIDVRLQPGCYLAL